MAFVLTGSNRFYGDNGPASSGHRRVLVISIQNKVSDLPIPVFLFPHSASTLPPHFRYSFSLSLSKVIYLSSSLR